MAVRCPYRGGSCGDLLSGVINRSRAVFLSTKFLTSILFLPTILRQFSYPYFLIVLVKYYSHTRLSALEPALSPQCLCLLVGRIGELPT